MAIEAGGKAGLFPVDEVTISYEKERGITAEQLEADKDAVYCREIDINLDELKAQVAYPFLPSNCKDIDEAEKDNIPIDQVVIGSCTNGRMEDLRMAAEILKNKKVHQDVRCLIFPGSQAVYKQALQEGLLEIFIDAECVVSTPTCGPCLGGHMGILAEGERCISTTNRNFVGRMGHIKSEVYLASPSTAAATAVNGVLSGAGDMDR
jgi:3-isopropylmalate/(R)-2-methylmalate dehydratase large subunit